MARRAVIAAWGLVVGALGSGAAACVDLFHSTDFDTLCVREPGNEACTSTRPEDAGQADSVAADVAPRPRIDFCAWSSAEARTQAERACTWLGACEGPLGWTKLGSCMTEAILAFDCHANPSLRPQGSVDDFWQCMAASKTCEDVDACAFPGGLQQCEPFGGPGSFTTCALDANADVLVECGNPAGGRPTGVAPCIGQSRTCATLDSSRAACSGRRETGCPSGSSRCDGTVRSQCDTSGTPSVDVGADCDGYGARECIKDLRGAQCTPDLAAPSCEGAYLECDGDKAFSCIDGRLGAIDCAKLDGTCDPERTTVGGRLPIEACRALAPGSSKPACDVPDACLTNSVRSCSAYAATPFVVDCKRHGLGACEVRANGHAACTPPGR